MPLSYKKICLSLLFCITGTYVKTDQTFGFYGRIFKNIVRGKIAELKANCHDNIRKTNDNEGMSFLEEITTKIDKLANAVDIEVNNKRADYIQRFSLPSFFIQETDKFLKNGPKGVQAQLILDCLDTLNNKALLNSFENQTVLMNEILGCINDAEKEASKS